MRRVSPLALAVLAALAALASPALALEIDCTPVAANGLAAGAILPTTDALDVAVDGSLVLGARADAALLYDAADPHAPSLLATWPVPAATIAHVAVDLPWAVVARTDGVLHVLDLTDPTAPASLPTGPPLAAPVTALAISSARIAAIADSASVALLQVIPDAAPQPVWSHALPGDGLALALTATQAYVAGTPFGLLTLDATDLTPEPVHQLALPVQGAWHGLAIAGDRLLAAEDHVVWIDAGPGQVPQTRHRLRSLDLDDPAAPALAEPLGWPGATAAAVASADGHGLFWDGRGLAVVTPPAVTPLQILGMLSRPQIVRAMAGSELVAVLATDAGLCFHAVAGAATPAPRAWYAAPEVAGGASRTALGNQYLLFAYHYPHGSGAISGWASRLHAVDLTDDTAILLHLGWTNDGSALPLPEPLDATGGTGPGDDRFYFRLGGDQILVAAADDPLAHTPLPVTGQLSAAAGWAFVVSGDTLWRVNCWDTADPFLASVHPLPAAPTVVGPSTGASLLLGYADGTVESWYFGQEVTVETFQIDAAVRALAVDRSLLFAGTDTGIQGIEAFLVPGIGKRADRDLGDVFPVADTTQPVTSLVAAETYVYAAQGDRGLRICRVPGPQITDLGDLGPPADTVALGRAAAFARVLLANRPDLGTLLNAHCVGMDVGEQPPAPPALSLRAVPNPFNPRTELRFTIERRQEVRLAVYDLRGRRVATLAGGLHDAGRHAVTWDGRDGRGAACASGVYLARLQAAGAAATVRLTLVR
jgi:hypothetical protein